MNFELRRNLQFTKLIKAEGRLREFNFTRHTVLGDTFFTVDVVDDRGNRIIFRMQRSGNGWSITNPDLPDWVLHSESFLQQFIEEEMSTDDRVHRVVEPESQTT
jgi:hypothetical protein